MPRERMLRDSPVKRAILAGPFPLSGEELAERFGISRVAVWKHVRELRELGYSIRSTGKGYVLEGKPDVPYPWELPVSSVYLPETASTMDVAWKLGDWTFVVAGTQRSGRGRRGSRWPSPPGGLYFSVPISPELRLSEAGSILEPVLSALLDALSDLGVGAEPVGKAIYVEDLKLGGVLVEVSGEMEEVRRAVVGVGLNVNNPVPEGAISLRMLLGEVSLLEVARKVLPAVEDGLRRFLRVRGSSKR
ncbi:biotin operon repressor [Thermococcus prieurii]